MELTAEAAKIQSEQFTGCTEGFGNKFFIARTLWRGSLFRGFTLLYFAFGGALRDVKEDFIVWGQNSDW